LKLEGNEEKFFVNVEYDTGKLYGVVKASREFVVYGE